MSDLYAAVEKIRTEARAFEQRIRQMWDEFAAAAPRLVVEDRTSDDEHLWRLLDRRAEELASARQQVINLSRDLAEARAKNAEHVRTIAALAEQSARLRSRLIEAGIEP